MTKKIIVNGGTLFLQPSGLKSFITNFIVHLSKKLPDNTIEILVPEKIENTFGFGSNCSFIHIPKISVAPHNYWFLFWDNIQIYEYIKKQNPVEVAFFLSTHHALPIHKLPVPELVVIHDIDLWKNPRPDWPIEYKLAYEIDKKAIQQADIVFTVSNFTKKEFGNFFHLSKIPIVPIYEDIQPSYKENKPANVQFLENNFGVKKEEYFLYVGSTEPRKNLKFLLDAHKQYVAQSSLKKPLVVFAATLKRTPESDFFKTYEKVQWHETLDPNGLYQLYKNAFAFIYPSRYEGFGLQILEAQNVGCPLLLSDIEVFREIAGDGAAYFELNDTQKLTQSMLDLEKNTEKRSVLLNNGYKNAKRYSWEKTVTTFVETLRQYNYL